ncbi:hypothetical protein C8Q72DRAFT_141738 [Fomitopsis betulina]|nr:hypothetical protein C8Q72DRAFT_141738 [Fomitopsis betulina]
MMCTVVYRFAPHLFDWTDAGASSQVADWKKHKRLCFTYLRDATTDCTGMNFGEKSAKGKSSRTRGEVLNDLMAWAQIHNGVTLSFACWQAMDLMTDIHKAETHFLGITLRKNNESTNPRAAYSLVDAQVLPLTLLVEKYKHMATAHDEQPVDMLENAFWADRRRRIADGGLGSVLAMSFELAPGEDMTVEEAVAKKNVPIWQPLGLFKEHARSLRSIPPLAHSFWKLSLKNALNGGAYDMKFRPWLACS